MSRRGRQRRQTHRRVDPHAGLRLLMRNDPLRNDEARDIELDGQLALELILSGRGGIDQLGKIGMVSNLAMLMAEKGIGRECLPYIQTAQAEICDAEARYRGERGDAARGRIGFSGPGRQAVLDLFEIYKQQILAVTRGTFEWALDEYTRRVDAGLMAREREEVTG